MKLSVQNASKGTLGFPDGSQIASGETATITWQPEWDDHPVIEAWVSEGLIVLSDAPAEGEAEAPSQPAPKAKGKGK